MAQPPYPPHPPAGADPRAGLRRAARVVLAGWAYLLLFAAVAHGLLRWPMLGVAAASWLLALPVLAAWWHQDATHRLLALHPYRSGAALHRWYARRVLPMALRVMLALLLTAAALLQTPFFALSEWVLLALAAPGYALLEAVFYRLGAAQFATERYAQRWVRRATHATLVLLLALAWLALRLSDHASVPLPLAERLGQWQAGWSEAPSHALRWALDALAWSQAGFETALSQLPADRRWQALAGLVLAPLALFGHSALAIAGCALSLPELRRASAVPLCAEVVPPRLTPERAAVWAAIGVLATWLWLDLAGRTEYLAQSRPSPFAVQALPECERIGGRVYRVGAEALLEQLGARTQKSLAASQVQACTALDKVRALAEPGVDAYLDWYFSLGAEWARLAAMLAGDAELLMRVKFEQLVLQDDGIGSALGTVQREYAAQWGAALNARADALALLESQHLVLSESQCRVVHEAPESPALLAVRGHSARLVASSGVALIAGSFAGTVAAKAMGKASMKAASKLLLKAAAKKSLGKAGAAAAGAALGTVVAPGLGTALGAGLGAAVGLALGAGVDLTLLAAEEMLTRENMRRELLEAVDESLAPYRASLSCGAARP
ncbi:MAG: hypothetical protein H3C29_02375 [Simplicispira suum]|uniref:hypothetical protein n=1 Tax=Simplicispira suum TaxID=2109915 RepID=UPI001C6AD7E4|nr:hypothetical protein [Simplicispira suum]MBW7832038.1 hypothetical protein [Simplicispira suum]